MTRQQVIEKIQERFIVFDGKLSVRREGMGEYDYRPAEKGDVTSALNEMADAAVEGVRVEIEKMRRFDADMKRAHKAHSDAGAGHSIGYDAAITDILNKLSGETLDNKANPASTSVETDTPKPQGMED